MAFRRGFKADANRIALRVREVLRLAPTDPLDPWRLCAHLDIQVKDLSKVVDEDGVVVGQHFLNGASGEFSAVLVPCGMHRAIVHNDKHTPVRQRSNLAHELAHCLLGHPLVPLLGVDGERNRNAKIEEEAVFLSGALLIPNEAAHFIVRTDLRASATRIYGVSSKMLTYGLLVSGAQIAESRRYKRDNARPSAAERA